MLLSAAAINDIQWWIDNLMISYNDIHLGNPVLTILTDASKTGWGAACSTLKTGGLFSEEESFEHKCT